LIKLNAELKLSVFANKNSQNMVKFRAGGGGKQLVIKLTIKFKKNDFYLPSTFPWHLPFHGSRRMDYP
jgi:hypothetical protein